mmetsp:Transcript_12349/g.34352  ORF Transcript_12349/g.34352 Transcript_12349/m.34352 type:complete len:265 (+) Transcript_12349:2458-3252(+)
MPVRVQRERVVVSGRDLQDLLARQGRDQLWRRLGLEVHLQRRLGGVVLVVGPVAELAVLGATRGEDARGRQPQGELRAARHGGAVHHLVLDGIRVNLLLVLLLGQDAKLAGPEAELPVLVQSEAVRSPVGQEHDAVETSRRPAHHLLILQPPLDQCRLAHVARVPQSELTLSIVPPGPDPVLAVDNQAVLRRGPAQDVFHLHAAQHLEPRRRRMVRQLQRRLRRHLPELTTPRTRTHRDRPTQTHTNTIIVRSFERGPSVFVNG